MGPIQWKKEYSVNVPSLDKQHKRILEIVNKLLAQQAQCPDCLKTKEVLDELQDYISEHFKTEEAYLLENHFPGYEEHRSEHNRFIDRFFEARKEFLKAGQLTSLNLFNFVWDWFSQHMNKVDKQMIRIG